MLGFDKDLILPCVTIFRKFQQKTFLFTILTIVNYYGVIF